MRKFSAPTKKCPMCEEEKPIAAFSMRGRVRTGPVSRCKVCRATVRRSAWADRRAIADIYQDAQELSVATDMIWHVDHIVPLKHSRVCGLHIAANLQLLTDMDNKRKSNRF